MSRIAVVGAGQAGLQFALGALKEGYEVTLVSDRTAEQIRDGRVMSTQCMFGDALRTERELGLNSWEQECPPIDAVRYSVGPPGAERPLQLVGRLDEYAQSVDQRLKMAGWLEEFERLGGDLQVRTAGAGELEELARSAALVVVAAGKGEIAALFERDDSRSPFREPQRWLAVAYVFGFEPLDPPSTFSISIVPGVGEFFGGPALTLGGPCATWCFEAIPGGDMDVFRDDLWRTDTAAYLQRCKEVFERYFPWEAPRARDAELTDEGGTLAGGFAPVVRKAVGKLPSGTPVLSIGDAAVLNDPLVGQGSNNAARSAAIALEEVRRGGEGPFDEAWMQRVAARSWEESARYSTAFTNLMLQPPPHIADVLQAGAEEPRIADHLANGTNDPSTLFPWIETPEGAREFIASKRAEAVV